MTDEVKPMNKEKAVDDFKPIEGLNLDKFAHDAATFFDDPDRYTEFLTGCFHRWKLQKGIKWFNCLINIL